MVIVTLEDDTSYLVDTDDEGMARHVVYHKLRMRMDFRGITSVSLVKSCKLGDYSAYYNSADADDNVPLKCRTGSSYKWGRQTMEYR